MAASAPSLLKRTFDSPDETRPAGSGKAAIVDLGQATFMRVTLPPGWRWSKDVKPIAHTDSCQAAHLGYMLSGRMHAVMDDGTEADFGPGDLGLASSAASAGLARLLGHGGLEATRIYVQPTDEDLAARVNRLDLNAYDRGCYRCAAAAGAAQGARLGPEDARAPCRHQPIRRLSPGARIAEGSRCLRTRRAGSKSRRAG